MSARQNRPPPRTSPRGRAWPTSRDLRRRLAGERRRGLHRRTRTRAADEQALRSSAGRTADAASGKPQTDQSTVVKPKPLNRQADESTPGDSSTAGSSAGSSSAGSSSAGSSSAGPVCGSVCSGRSAESLADPVAKAAGRTAATPETDSGPAAAEVGQSTAAEPQAGERRPVSSRRPAERPHAARPSARGAEPSGVAAALRAVRAQLAGSPDPAAPDAPSPRPKQTQTTKPTYRHTPSPTSQRSRSTDVATSADPDGPLGSQSPEPALTPGIRPATPDPLGTPDPLSTADPLSAAGSDPLTASRPAGGSRPGRLRRPTRLADGARLSGRSEPPAPSRQWGRTRRLRRIPTDGTGSTTRADSAVGTDPTGGAGPAAARPTGGAGSIGWRRSGWWGRLDCGRQSD